MSKKNVPPIMLYGNLFGNGRRNTYTGWLNLHAEGSDPVRVKVINLDLRANTATLRLEGIEEYRYIEANVTTMGDEVAGDADRAAISAAALRRTPARRGNHHAQVLVFGHAGDESIKPTRLWLLMPVLTLATWAGCWAVLTVGRLLASLLGVNQ